MQQRFSHGDTVYKEGDIGGDMFLILSGQISLSKTTKQGPMEIEILKEGERFGEVGLLNGGARTMTATAVSDLIVEIIDTNTLNLKNNFTKTTLPQKTNTHDIPYSELTPDIAENWFSRLIKSLDQHSRKIEVRVTPLFDDENLEHSRSLIKILRDMQNLNVRLMTKDGPFIQDKMSEELRQSCHRFSKKTLQKFGGDIHIWGHVSKNKVLNLYFISNESGFDCVPITFSGFEALPIPTKLNDNFRMLLYAVILGATHLSKSEKFNVITDNISDAVKDGVSAIKNPPVEFNSGDRANLLACLGHISAIAGQYLNDSEFLTLASDTYLKSLENLPREFSIYNSGIIHRNLAILLSQKYDQTHDLAVLQDAIDHITLAVQSIPQNLMPLEWADTQNRLGLMLYKMHLTDENGDAEQLTKAILSFQAALKIFSRIEFPKYWANIMHNYARAAQVLGGQRNNPAIVQKSINACRSTLEIWGKSRFPYQWAQGQNTLGSALFLLGKMTSQKIYVESAHDAFSAAQHFYSSNSLDKMAHITASNIRHVEHLLYGQENKGSHPIQKLNDKASLINQCDHSDPILQAQKINNAIG